MTVIPSERPVVSPAWLLRAAFWALIAASLLVPYALGF